MAASKGFNLFLSSRRLTQRREDHLTEFLAAALEISPPFRGEFANVLLGSHGKARGWATAPTIDRVETQTGYEGTSCCPDLRLTLSNGAVILCEHKIDADETMGPETDPEGQLVRYLKLAATRPEIQGVAYVRSSWKAPGGSVLKNPIYVCPEGRDHFLWRDFYPALRASASDAFVRWVAEAFENLGFTPPTPGIGDLEDNDPSAREINRKNFAKHWDRTKQWAKDHGWWVGAGSIIQVYLRDNADSMADLVIVSPRAASGSFWMRFRPRQQRLTEGTEALLSRLSAVAGTNAIKPEVERVTIKQEGKPVEVVQVASSLGEVVGDAREPDKIAARLFDFVTPFVQASMNTTKKGPSQPEG